MTRTVSATSYGSTDSRNAPAPYTQADLARAAELWPDHHGLVVSLLDRMGFIRQACKVGYAEGADGLLADAYEIFVGAVRDHDPEKGPLSAIIAFRLRGYMARNIHRDFARANVFYKKLQPDKQGKVARRLDEVAKDSEDKDVTRKDLLPGDLMSGHHVARQHDTRRGLEKIDRAVYKMIAELPARHERTALILERAWLTRYRTDGERASFREIGEAFGVTWQTVQNSCKHIDKILKENRHILKEHTWRT